MSKLCVLLVGAYGFFGRRLAQRLAGDARLELLLAGRDVKAAAALRRGLEPAAAASLSEMALDVQGEKLRATLAELAPAVLVNASGPYQGQDYRVPNACIACGVHYVDLADARDFVAGITALDAAARDAGVLVTSGASSVPALSCAVLDELTAGWREVRRIEIGISPGNRSERGLATVQAVLGWCGRPIPARGDDGRELFGWRGSWRHAYPAPVGARLLSPCDVPDLVLLPARYPGTPQVVMGGGLELRALHRGLNLIAWLVQHGCLADAARHARWLKRGADALGALGSDAGAMHVQVSGIDSLGAPRQRLWHLVATRGDGPFVPTLAAACLVRGLASGALTARGAMPCLGLASLADFRAAAEGLAITMQEQST
jgi:hypothetical protein